MMQKFIKKGYEIVEENEKADVYVINTCTVTNMADRKSRQMARRVKEINKNAILAVCGCYVQVAKDKIEEIEDVDIILGNNEKSDIVEIVEQFEKNINENQGYIKTMWCGSEECEEKIHDLTGAKSRCIPFEQEHISDTCVCCGKPATKMVVWGRQY